MYISIHHLPKHLPYRLEKNYYSWSISYSIEKKNHLNTKKFCAIN